MKASKNLLKKVAVWISCAGILISCEKTYITNNYNSTQPTTNGLGLVFTPPAIYSALPVAAVPTTGGTLPNSYFLEIPSSAFNQLSQGSCASCASAMAKSITDHIKYSYTYPSNSIIYSPSYLYNQVKINPNDCGKGSYLFSNLELLKSQGICRISDMPYIESDCFTQPNNNQIQLASNNKIASYETVSPFDAATIKKQIFAGYPVIVAFEVDNHFYNDYWNPNNMNTVWSTFGIDSNSSHATLLYGWDNSKHAFKMLNQWGTQWGNNGSIWVDYNLVENRNVFREAYIMKNPTSNPGANNLQINGDLNFGSITVNSSTSRSIQLTNSGSSSINVSGVSISAPFSTNWNNGTILPGASQTITVTFNPTSQGNFSSNLTVNSNASNNPVSLLATGTGTQQTGQTRIISLSGNLSFGNVTVGQTSSKTLTISNTGNSSLTVSSITSPQGYSGSYSGSIAAGSSVNVSIIFSPTTVQSYLGNIIVNSDATSGINSISVSGTGIQQPTQTRIISLTGDLSFGNVVIGQTGTKTLNISNQGNSALTVNSITTPQYFSANYNGSIPAGSSVNVPITFSPVNVQSYSGTVTVNSDATSGVNTISTSGNGVNNTPVVMPPIGTYGTCAAVGSYTCPPTYGLGVINGRVMSINTSTHQIVVEIKKCDGTSFNAGGNLNVVNLLCGGTGAVSYGFGPFSAGVYSFQMTITDNNMVGSKAYVPFIVQGTAPNYIYYSAPTLVITY